MKNKVKFLITAVLSVLLFSSCSMPDGKGKILIVNETENDMIKYVYARNKDSTEPGLQWTQPVLNKDDSAYVKDPYFYIDSGSYYVEISVRKPITDILYYEDVDRIDKILVEVREDDTAIIYYDGEILSLD